MPPWDWTIPLYHLLPVLGWGLLLLALWATAVALVARRRG